MSGCLSRKTLVAIALSRTNFALIAVTASRSFGARMVGALFVVALLLLPTNTAHAHPYGISSVNRLIAVEPHRDELKFAFVLDFAELPAENELQSLDADHDGSVTPQEQQRYLLATVDPSVASWSVTLDATPLALRVVERSLEVNDGEARLHTLRVMAEVRAIVPVQLQAKLEYLLVLRDLRRNDRPGWRELRVDDTSQVRAQLLHSIPSRDGGAAGRELLRMDEATFRLQLRTASGANRVGQSPTRAPIRRAKAVPTQWLVLAIVLALLMISGTQALRSRFKRAEHEKS